MGAGMSRRRLPGPFRSRMIAVLLAILAVVVWDSSFRCATAFQRTLVNQVYYIEGGGGGGGGGGPTTTLTIKEMAQSGIGIRDGGTVYRFKPSVVIPELLGEQLFVVPEASIVRDADPDSIVEIGIVTSPYDEGDFPAEAHPGAAIMQLKGTGVATVFPKRAVTEVIAALFDMSERHEADLKKLLGRVHRLDDDLAARETNHQKQLQAIDDRIAHAREETAHTSGFLNGVLSFAAAGLGSLAFSLAWRTWRSAGRRPGDAGTPGVTTP